MKPLRSTAPPSSLLSPEFQYTPAANTNIRERFERIRRERAEAIADAERAKVLLRFPTRTK